jgi:sec-independent protein translocase protein TatA
VVIFLLFFGGKKIPEMAKGLGEGIRNFKNAVKTEGDDAETKKQG